MQRNEIRSFFFLTVKIKIDDIIPQKYSFSDSIHSGMTNRLLSTGINWRKNSGYSIRMELYICIWNQMRKKKPRT